MSSHPAGMTLSALNRESRFYVLHVDGIGDYGMTSDSGFYCLFLFTSENTVAGFVDRMEMPEHRAFTAINFDLRKTCNLLSDAARIVHSVAVDPKSECDLSPVSRDDFLRVIEAAIRK